MNRSLSATVSRLLSILIFTVCRYPFRGSFAKPTLPHSPLPFLTASNVTLVSHLPLPMAFIAAARPFCVERTRAPALPPAAASGLPPAAAPPLGAAAVAAGGATAACPLSAGGRSSTLERSGPAPPVSPRICSAAKCSLLCSGGSVAPLRRWVRVGVTPRLQNRALHLQARGSVTLILGSQSVQRLLEGAAVRLALSLNPVDPTIRGGMPVIIRQSDQEMLWLELTQSPPDPLLRLFVLPEEYFCPAYWPQVNAPTTKGISFYEYVLAWATQGKKAATQGKKKRSQVVVPQWKTGYRNGGYPCKATHFHHSHTHLLETRPPLKESTVAAFEHAVGRGSRETAET